MWHAVHVHGRVLGLEFCQVAGTESALVAWRCPVVCVGTVLTGLVWAALYTVVHGVSAWCYRLSPGRA